MRPDPDPRSTVDELLELYAIDALDARESKSFESALLTLTASDRVDAVDRIRATRDAVGRMAAEVAAVPPAHLRAAILGAIGTESVRPLRVVAEQHEAISPWSSAELPLGDEHVDSPAPGVPGTPASDVPVPDELAARRISRRRRIALSVSSAAAALVLVVGGVIVGSTLSDSSSDQPAVAQSDSFDQLRTVMSASDAETHRTELTGVAGTVVVTSSRTLDRAVVVLDKAPQPPDQRTYQLWLIGNDHAPRPAGLIDADGTTKPFVVTGLSGSRTVGMTLEPVGGSPAPTGEVLAAVSI